MKDKAPAQGTKRRGGFSAADTGESGVPAQPVQPVGKPQQVQNLGDDPQRSRVQRHHTPHAHAAAPVKLHTEHYTYAHSRTVQHTHR